VTLTRELGIHGDFSCAGSVVGEIDPFGWRIYLAMACIHLARPEENDGGEKNMTQHSQSLICSYPDTMTMYGGSSFRLNITPEFLLHLCSTQWGFCGSTSG